jgi:hypothetical protein
MLPQRNRGLSSLSVQDVSLCLIKRRTRRDPAINHINTALQGVCDLWALWLIDNGNQAVFRH